jgi:hypothetical protein
MVLGDVAARGRKERFVVRAQELMPTGAVDHATHEHLRTEKVRAPIGLEPDP